MIRRQRFFTASSRSVWASCAVLSWMRSGRTIVTLDRSETSLEAVVGMMTGALTVAA